MKDIFLAAPLLLLCAACGSNTKGANAGESCNEASDCANQLVCDPSTQTCEDISLCTTDQECGDGAQCVSSTCTPDLVSDLPDAGSCGGALFSAQSVPPNVLILLDRTGSMNSSLDGGGPSKWNIAKDAIQSLTTQYDDGVQFGVMLFPGSEHDEDQGRQCRAGGDFHDANDSNVNTGVGINPGTNNGANVTSFVNGSGTTRFGTPLVEALDSLAGYEGLLDPTRPNYVLLISDGADTCAGGNVASKLTTVTAALRSQSEDVKTFVVGFGSGASPAELNAIADAGGTARANAATKYYQADNEVDLSSDLAEITGSVLSCTYVLDDEPPAEEEISIYFDSTSVDSSQWNYDASLQRIVFEGAACDQLSSGEVTDLQIIFGCPDDIIMVD